MPITTLHRERIERSLAGHEAVLHSSDRPPSPMKAKVHTILLELGRNNDLLTLVDDFVDSAELVDELRDHGASVLRDRGITLPEGVTMGVVDDHGDESKPILRFQFAVQKSTIIVDYDPIVGASTRLALPTRSAHGLHL
jgi:hypothetical protein